MEIAYEEIKELENYILNEIIYFIMDKKYESNIEEAKEMFLRVSEGEASTIKEQGFLIWLLWDYKLEDSKSFIEEYYLCNKDNISTEAEEMIKSFMDASFSIYEIHKDAMELKATDIFSKKELIVEDTMQYQTTDNKSLVIGRIYEYNNKKYFLDEYIIVHKYFKSMIEKNIYEKFQLSKSEYGFEGIEAYIQTNSLLIYKLGVIIDQLIKEQDENQDSMKVWQSIYVYKDRDLIKQELLNHNYINFDYEEDGAIYLKLIDSQEEATLAVIILYEHKLEVECNNEIDIVESKSIIEEIIGNGIQHFKDEVLTISDII